MLLLLARLRCIDVKTIMAAAVKTRLVYVGLSVFVIGVGATGALQAAINTRASEHFAGVYLLGTAVSFYSGWALLCLIVVLETTLMKSAESDTADAEWLDQDMKAPRAHAETGRCARTIGRRTFAVFTCSCLRWKRRPPLYQLLPGVFGVLFVTSSVSITLVTGFALYFVLTTAGFLTMSATIDHFGWFGNGRRKVSAQRMSAMVVAMVGAVLAVFDRLRTFGAGDKITHIDPGLMAMCVILSIAAGILLPLQASINRKAAELLSSKYAATWWSFSVGCIAIAVALAIQLGIQQDRAALLPQAFATSDVLHYMGGPCGVLTVGSAIFLVRLLGSAQYFICMVCGQLAGSIAVDATGILGARVAPITPIRGCGVGLVLLASLAMQLPDVQWARTCRAKSPAPNGLLPGIVTQSEGPVTLPETDVAVMAHGGNKERAPADAPFS